MTCPDLASPQPGEPCRVLVDGTLREGVVIRIRGDRFYVKHETDGSLYTCAWFDQSVLCAPACSGAH